MASIRPRTRSLAVVAAVVFAAVGLFDTWVGLLDFLSAANLQYKLLGFAFAIAGLTMLGGSAVLAREPWRCTYGRLAAVAAGAAGVFVGGYLLLLEYRAPRPSPRGPRAPRPGPVRVHVRSTRGGGRGRRRRVRRWLPAPAAVPGTRPLPPSPA